MPWKWHRPDWVKYLADRFDWQWLKREGRPPEHKGEVRLNLGVATWERSPAEARGGGEPPPSMDRALDNEPTIEASAGDIRVERDVVVEQQREVTTVVESPTGVTEVIGSGARLAQPERGFAERESKLPSPQRIIIPQDKSLDEILPEPPKEEDIDKRKSGATAPEGSETSQTSSSRLKTEAVRRGITAVKQSLGPHYLNLGKLQPEPTQAAATQQSTRVFQICVPIDQNDHSRHYVKSIAYGNANAVAEMTSAAFYKMLGLECPTVRLGMHGDQLNFTFSEDTRRDFDGRHPSGYACIASEMVEGYEDLGKLLLHRDRMRGLIPHGPGVESGGDPLDVYEELLERHQAAVARESGFFTRLRGVERQIEQLGANAGAAEKEVLENEKARLIKAIQKEKREQIGILHEMADMLPESMQNGLVKALQGALIIGNWDLFNFYLFNGGFNFSRYDPERPETIKDISCVFVDFGNSGPIGFKGGYKEDSHEHARARARPVDPYLPDQLFQQSSSKFTGEMPLTLMALSELPRNRPFVHLFRKQIELERELLQDQNLERSNPMHDNPSKVPPAARPFFSEVIEVGYRLSLVPDEAIDAIARKFWVLGRGHEIFPYADPDNPHNKNADQIAQIMKDRKANYLRNHFTPADIDTWRMKHPHEAKAAHEQVAAALNQLVGININSQTLTPPSPIRVSRSTPG